jgi:hypothetical protein
MNRKVKLSLNSNSSYHLSAVGYLYKAPPPSADPVDVHPIAIRNTVSAEFDNLLPKDYVFRFNVKNGAGGFTITAFVWEGQEVTSQSKEYDTNKTSQDNFLFPFTVRA